MYKLTLHDLLDFCLPPFYDHIQYIPSIILPRLFYKDGKFNVCNYSFGQTFLNDDLKSILDWLKHNKRAEYWTDG